MQLAKPAAWISGPDDGLLLLSRPARLLTGLTPVSAELVPGSIIGGLRGRGPTPSALGRGQRRDGFSHLPVINEALQNLIYFGNEEPLPIRGKILDPSLHIIHKGGRLEPGMPPESDRCDQLLEQNVHKMPGCPPFLASEGQGLLMVSKSDGLDVIRGSIQGREDSIPQVAMIGPHGR